MDLTRIRARHACRALRHGRVLVLAGLVAGCATGPAPARTPSGPEQAESVITLPPPLPDTTGFGTHVLALARSPHRVLWVGTYGEGIYMLPRGAREWERISAADSSSISWDFVNSIAPGTDSLEVWYGTVGNGFGVSRDGGRTWRNWQFRQLGPEWQYVAPNGVVLRRDTVYIATADGLRLSGDGGASWRCIQGADRVSGGAAPREDGCTERITSLPTEYLLALDVGADGSIWAGHLRGLSVSRDGGRSWAYAEPAELQRERVRAVAVADSGVVWTATERTVYVDSSGRGNFRPADLQVPGWPGLPGAPRALITGPDVYAPMVATSQGMVLFERGVGARLHYLAAAERYRPAADVFAGAWLGLWPVGGAAGGLQRVLGGETSVGAVGLMQVHEPEPARHLWFQRPIADTSANPWIDGTYRYGSTMGGNFQQHQGVEFNNPAGTPVHAIGDGVVVFAGPAEAGANTVAIRHDRRWEDQHVFSTYYHNSALLVRSGQRVRAGEVIARVGNTGRATNDHLHLEVHVAPGQDSARIIDPAERFPPHTVNPQLWIEPAPGTGIVAGRVFDADGEPVPGARIYGLVIAYPEETPFSFAETYRDRARPDPAYGEHFAVGDVGPGVYLLGVNIGDVRVWRRVRVAAGQVTFVEFRP
ncbi:MAG TPA: peptidoglycan DD-metalloendopeptidase family protein [Longimicrobiales bacterium]|nr:peptidoglycan DD-metalloendopeptidase family protein [Longimicrobiales bacterium]